MSEKAKKLKTKWLLYSVIGLLLLGFGLSLLGEAILFKFNNDFSWFYWGTAALVVFNAGVGFVGEAIVTKFKLEKEKKTN